MSDNIQRDFRPDFHFTPESCWINDPNGLVKIDGRYHLFAQYHPDSSVWGPMHWYHAVSDNLIDWEHLGVAIPPDELGMIFSGSAAVDSTNSSGLAPEGMPCTIAMYTSHGECEQQSIAFSVDGVNFKKYENNPVIPNPGLKDFRDPKLFWNPVYKCWSMVLAATDRVIFYKSRNFIDWEKTGEFGHEGNHLPGIWECPDMIPLCGADGKLYWILIGSMIPDDLPSGQSNTQYFIGDFDGDTFVNSNPFGTFARVDSGFDNYAGVTFNNSDESILISWASNWRYADKIPTTPYRGQMTIPRMLSVIDTPLGGLRLAAVPTGFDTYAKEETELQSESKIFCQSFVLTVRGTGKCCLKLKNSDGRYFEFGVNGENKLYINRSNAGISDFQPDFATKAFAIAEAPRYYEGKYELVLIFDVSVAELFIDDGTCTMTALVFPELPYDIVEYSGEVQASYTPLQR